MELVASLLQNIARVQNCHHNIKPSFSSFCHHSYQMAEGFQVSKVSLCVHILKCHHPSTRHQHKGRCRAGRAVLDSSKSQSTSCDLWPPVQKSRLFIIVSTCILSVFSWMKIWDWSQPGETFLISLTTTNSTPLSSTSTEQWMRPEKLYIEITAVNLKPVFIKTFYWTPTPKLSDWLPLSMCVFCPNTKQVFVKQNILATHENRILLLNRPDFCVVLTKV